MACLRVSEEMKNKRGAPKGNQNARKHGCYAKYLTEEERAELRDFSRVEGVDDEIALLRLRISWALRDGTDARVLAMMTASLGRMIRTKSLIGVSDKDALKEGLVTVLRDIALPAGLVGETFRKRLEARSAGDE